MYRFGTLGRGESRKLDTQLLALKRSSYWSLGQNEDTLGHAGDGVGLEKGLPHYSD